MENEYKVLIRIDSSNRVIEINSDAFISDTTEWIEIDSGDGDRFHHAQNHYLSEPIITDDSVYRYKYENNAVTERTQEEMDADKQEVVDEPTDAEINADAIAELAELVATQDDAIAELAELLGGAE